LVVCLVVTFVTFGWLVGYVGYFTHVLLVYTRLRLRLVGYVWLVTRLVTFILYVLLVYTLVTGLVTFGCLLRLRLHGLRLVTHTARLVGYGWIYTLVVHVYHVWVVTHVLRLVVGCYTPGLVGWFTFALVVVRVVHGCLVTLVGWLVDYLRLVGFVVVAPFTLVGYIWVCTLRCVGYTRLLGYVPLRLRLVTFAVAVGYVYVYLVTFPLLVGCCGSVVVVVWLVHVGYVVGCWVGLHLPHYGCCYGWLLVAFTHAHCCCYVGWLFVTLRWLVTFGWLRLVTHLLLVVGWLVTFRLVGLDFHYVGYVWLPFPVGYVWLPFGCGWLVGLTVGWLLVDFGWLVDCCCWLRLLRLRLLGCTFTFARLFCTRCCYLVGCWLLITFGWLFGLYVCYRTHTLRSYVCHVYTRFTYVTGCLFAFCTLRARLLPVGFAVAPRWVGWLVYVWLRLVGCYVYVGWLRVGWLRCGWLRLLRLRLRLFTVGLIYTLYARLGLRLRLRLGYVLLRLVTVGWLVTRVRTRGWLVVTLVVVAFVGLLGCLHHTHTRLPVTLRLPVWFAVVYGYVLGCGWLHVYVYTLLFCVGCTLVARCFAHG